MTNPRLKICQIMAGDDEGGLENHFASISNGLAEKNCDIIVIGHPKYASRMSDQIRYYPLDLTLHRRHLPTLFRIIKILKNERPDIIHAQANKATAILVNTFGLSGLIGNRLAGKKIATIHSVKKNTKVFQHTDALIGVSKGVVANINHSNCEVIHNGVAIWDGDRLNKSALANRFNLDQQKPISLAIGRLVPVKAYGNLIKSWRKPFGSLIIAGEGPEYEKLNTLIQATGLQEHIVLAGNCNDIRSMLPAADLMVFSSKREGFSYALIEALLAELPVLSTRVPGAEEILPQECLVATDDIDGLSRLLEMSLIDLPLLRARCAPVFKWASDTLTDERMIDHTYNFYLKQL